MALSPTLALGIAVPDVPHAVSVQLPTWQDMCSMGLGEVRVMTALKNGYPRSFLHKDVQALFKICESKFAPAEGRKIMLFSNAGAAEACKEFMISVERHGDKAVAPNHISLFPLGVTCDNEKGEQGNIPVLYAVLYPEESFPISSTFWRLTGTGISSRLAEKALQYTDSIQKIDALNMSPPQTPHSVFSTIRSRVSDLIGRAPLNPEREKKVAENDVYLYPSGMSAIYHIHQMLGNWRGMESAIVGFPYELTTAIMETYGPGFKFYSLGTDREIDAFEKHLEQLQKRGQKIQAAWCECPSNPLLRTVDLERIQRLADKYDFPIVCDDTIGSFANVDVLDIADIVITSLTKSFNGFADLLAGSAILNPNSKYYDQFRSLSNGSYVNNLFIDDALQLEYNSRDFLSRAATLNETAEYLVDFLQPLVSDPMSVVTKVYYPKVCWSKENYHKRMRPATEEFVPGYGGLFTIEFDTVASGSAFLDALDVHKGPSLGAHITLAQPYVQMVLQKKKEWAARHGLSETIIRISVGLENKDVLLNKIQTALLAAEKQKSRSQ